MTPRHTFSLVFLTTALLLPHALSAAETRSQRPNVILFLVDDLGWTDLGCFGSRYYETPNIDRLAANGMKFTDAYAACTVCSPTRAAIIAGKYPARLHLTDWITGHRRRNPRLRIPQWTMQLGLEEITLAEALKPAGYAAAHVGKWHLGNEPYYPQHQGFDLNIAGDRFGAPPSYFWPYRRTRGGKIVREVPLSGGKPGEYLTDRLTDEAIRFINTADDKPFFLYFAYYTVHTPLEAKKELIAHYKAKLEAGTTGGQQCPVYAAMIHSLDQSVGRIVQQLRKLKIDRQTVIIFASDNGGQILPACRGLPVTSNAPLRAGKGSAYEGGVRVPLVINWPGVVPPGSICHDPVISVDYYPTILDIVGQSANPKHQLDGESLVPLLKQTGALKRDAVYWHYPHYHPGGATPYGAVRQGDFRLVEFFEDNRAELYDLRKDIGEKNDLSAKMPDKTRELRATLAEWRNAVGAQLPVPNSDYDPSRKTKGRPWLR